MAKTKTAVLTVRTTPEIKAMLKVAADLERRSASSMLEVMVLDYSQRNNPEQRGSLPLHVVFGAALKTRPNGQ